MSCKVLVIAGLSGSRTAITELLRQCECEVHLAHQPSEALALARQIKPNAVFVSLDNTPLDTWDWAQQFHSEAGLTESKLVAIAPPDYDAEAIRRAGFHHFIPTPIELSALQLVLGGKMPVLA